MARWTTFLAIAAVAASATMGAAPPSGAEPGSTQGSAGKVDWPQYHGEPNHQGLNRAEHLVGRSNVSNLSLAWIGNGATFGDDLVFKSSPTVVDGAVYFGTEAGQLLAFPANCHGSQCEPTWRKQLTQSIYNTPAVVDGVLYVGTASPEGSFYAFDVADCAAEAGACEPLWSFGMAVGTSSPTVKDGVVYVGSQSSGVYAFDADGCGRKVCKPLWIGHTNGYVLNSPAVAHGVVYAGDSTGYLYAFDASGCGQAADEDLGAIPSCTALWRGAAANPIYDSSPVVHGGFVYTTSFAAYPNSFLEVFDATGCGKRVCDPAWRGGGGHYLNSAPAVAYGSVYLGSGDGTLRVYPAKGCGNPKCPARWFGFAAGPVATIESPPMVANGVVYVGGNNGRVRAFPARGCGHPECDKLWEFITQDPLVNSSPVMVNGTLYLSGTNFSRVPMLYVFELAGG